MLIYIEGNIGSGKSTFIDNLNLYLDNFLKLDLDARVVQEPVDEWMSTKDSDGENILEKFYTDQSRWSYCFQMNSFISRVKKIIDSITYETSNNNGLDKLIIAERSIYTDKNCFAENCYENGNMTKIEYDIYCKWNEWLSDQFNMRPTAYIYLKCNPNVNHTRISQRNREGENNIPITYLEQLHEKHEKWMTDELNNVPVFTIDATRNFKDPEEMELIFNELYIFIQSLCD